MGGEELIGWIGAALYIVAYLLLSIGLIKAKSVAYHLLNILGAIGLIVNGIYFNDFPNIIVNAVWLAIGIFAIHMIYKARGRSEKLKHNL